MDGQRVYPVLVATTWTGGAHHVVEVLEAEFPFRPLRELCAEHLLDGCVNCGRALGAHDRHVDCDQHSPASACGCGLEKWIP